MVSRRLRDGCGCGKQWISLIMPDVDMLFLLTDWEELFFQTRIGYTAVMETPTNEPGVPVNTSGSRIRMCMLGALHACAFGLSCSLLVSCHVWTPDSLSRGFYCHYQIVLSLSDIILDFSRVNAINLHTFWGINPNFRVGQLPVFVKNKIHVIYAF